MCQSCFVCPPTYRMYVPHMDNGHGGLGGNGGQEGHGCLKKNCDLTKLLTKRKKLVPEY